MENNEILVIYGNEYEKMTRELLEAADLGIGFMWIMYFIPEAVRVEFGLLDNVEPVAILIMGYMDAELSEAHFKRRDLDEYVSYR